MEACPVPRLPGEISPPSLSAAGKMTQAEIARQLGASRQSVSRWYEAWQRDQPGWIAGAGRAGPKPKLDKRQRKSLDKALRQGAPAHGFGTALWTLPRVATLIERLTGVRYHPGHVCLKAIGNAYGTNDLFSVSPTVGSRTGCSPVRRARR